MTLQTLTGDEAMQAVSFRARVEALREDNAEQERALAEQRQFAAANHGRITAEWNALPDTPMTMDQHVSAIRSQMGEERWAELQKEWTA